MGLALVGELRSWKGGPDLYSVFKDTPHWRLWRVVVPWPLAIWNLLIFLTLIILLLLLLYYWLLLRALVQFLVDIVKQPLGILATEGATCWPEACDL